jgi:high-affinity Fe2+/Pb2+ permease
MDKIYQPKKPNAFPLNRVVAITGGAISLAAAVFPVLANLDWTSTAGVLGGVLSLNMVVMKWLSGWQAHEAREAKK